jgi:hypothetical protein
MDDEISISLMKRLARSMKYQFILMGSKTSFYAVNISSYGRIKRITCRDYITPAKTFTLIFELDTVTYEITVPDNEKYVIEHLKKIGTIVDDLRTE